MYYLYYKSLFRTVVILIFASAISLHYFIFIVTLTDLGT